MWRSPVGKYHTSDWAAGLLGSSMSTPPWPGMYCFSTGTSSLPLVVGTQVPSMSEPVW